MKTELSDRLISLDALRGFTIVGMVIVNNPGSWSHIYTPLQHADWNGITPTDYIFPFFLFIVGVSVALAYDKKIKVKGNKTSLLKRIFVRSIKIYCLGIFLWLWPEFDFTSIRWVGVLPRISVVFLVCGILFLYTNWRQQLITAVVILIGYWVMMSFVPIPGIGMPGLTMPEKNWANYIDSIVLPGVMWQKTWDPEGLLSTFPAIASGISGMLIGRLLLSVDETYRKLTLVFFAGIMLMTIGGVWNWIFPINKNLWTSSYVVYTSGLATVGLGACMLIMDVKGYTRWASLGRIYGANAITAYVLAESLSAIFSGGLLFEPSLSERWMTAVPALGFSEKLASFMYALLYMLIIFIPAYLLYRNKIFIKV